MVLWGVVEPVASEGEVEEPDVDDVLPVELPVPEVVVPVVVVDSEGEVPDGFDVVDPVAVVGDVVVVVVLGSPGGVQSPWSQSPCSHGGW